MATASNAQQSARFGNPFLLACDELQSRLYNLVAGQNTFEILKEHYPDSGYAEETVYLILQYFGWERHTYRYGPYSQDAEIIGLAARIRDHFATAQRFPMGPFCFFRTEQRALGEAVIESVATEIGPSEETMSLFKFRLALQQPPLSQSRSVQDSLTALRVATNSENLEARDRLAQVQNDLVDLVNCLESRLGVALVSYTRLKAPVVPGLASVERPVLLV